MKTGNSRRILSAILTLMMICSITVSALAEGGHEQAKKAAVSCLKSSVAKKCPIATFETDDPLLSTASYTYESAIAALALMSEGDFEDAAKILDGFVKGMRKNKEFQDRFRNAQMVGKASDQPGYWNNALNQWIQDAYQVGVSTKSSCAAALALLTFHQVSPNDDYLNTAVKGIDWVIANCQDGTPGFTAGYTGWAGTEAYTPLTYKSTSDNLWMAAVCTILAEATGWDKYTDAASSATEFVTESMFSSGDSRFFQGTAEDGETPVTNLVVADVQALAELCLGDDSGMDNIDSCLADDDGYSYDNSNTDGSWLEGTAIAALAFKEIGEDELAEDALSMMAGLQLPSGSFPQASIPELETGELDRVIVNLPSVGPCAWFILAENGHNPFRLLQE